MNVRTIATSLVIGHVALATSIGTAAADHRIAVDVGIDGPGACGATTITATATVPNPANMYLVVHADGETQAINIPVDESSVSLSVGPIFTQSVETQTISWRIYGGGERDYDDPHWNGYGEPGFGADVTAYGNEVEGFDWVIAGPDDPNPFTTWNEISADTCAPTSKDDCKDGGWQAYGFRNQGDCVSHVNTSNP